MEETFSYSFKMKTLLDIKKIQKKIVSLTVTVKQRSLSNTSMDEGVSIETNSQNFFTQEQSNLLFVDFIKSEKIAMGTISFSLERAPAAGTMEITFFAIICLNNSPHCLF